MTKKSGTAADGQSSVAPWRWDFARLGQGVIEAANLSAAAGASASRPPPGLYLVATPIGHRGDITLRALLTLAHVDAVLCEDTRTTGALLRAYGIDTKLLSFHDHNEDAREEEVLRLLQDGAALALVSDAGMPLISDPGFPLLCACAEAGIMVTACPGASALPVAMALSGLPTDPCLFFGFLPSSKRARRAVLDGLRNLYATLIFYESPHRLAASLAAMQEALGDRPAAVARELTKLHEECRRAPLGELAVHYAANPPRGEITVVVAPPDSIAGRGAALDLDSCLRLSMARGDSLRDAVHDAAEATGLPRSIVYARALELREEMP